MFDDRWRHGVDTGVAPWGARLGKIGITPNSLTLFGLLCAIGTAIAIASGHTIVAFILFLLSVLPDLLDGAVARATMSASSRGAFFDSVADRTSDSLYLFGMAWYLDARHGVHIAMLPMGVLAITSLIPYQRAKAEALGFNAKGGIMERAERMILLGVAFALPFTMIAVLWIVLALSAVTAVQRFVKVWKQASAHIVPRRRVVTGQRWEEWRTQYVETLQARKEARVEKRSERREARVRRRSSRSSRWSRP